MSEVQTPGPETLMSLGEICEITKSGQPDQLHDCSKVNTRHEVIMFMLQETKQQQKQIVQTGREEEASGGQQQVQSA